MKLRSTMKSVVLGGLIALTATSMVAGQANPNKAKLLTPAQMTEKAPDVFKAKLDTSAGAVVIEVHRDWSPLGADRFYNLVKYGFYDDCRFFRVLDGFMAQIGMNGDPPSRPCGAERT